MKLLIVAGNLAFTLCSLVLGLRLCLLAARTRQSPELLLGVGFLCGGFLGHTLGWLLYRLGPGAPQFSLIAFALRAGAALACLLMAVLAFRVFRPTTSWAKIIVVLEAAALATYVLRDTIMGRPPSTVFIRQPLYWVHSIALASPYIWLALESLRYQASLRRRWAIGLAADLVLATRMRLWGIGLGSIGAMLLMLEVIRVYSVLQGRPFRPELLISSLGLVCAVSLWLAFFTPGWWVRRIQARAAAPPE